MVNFGYEFLFGAALGFTLTIPPGPMNAFIVAQSVLSHRRGIVSGLGAISADALLGTAVFLLSSSVDLRIVETEVYIIGSVVMAYFGLRLLRPRSAGASPPLGNARTYLTALVLGVANPFQILWWLTAGLAFAYLGGLPLFVGLFGAIAVWIIALPFAVHAGARGSPRVGAAIPYASGAVMLAFAAYFALLALS